MTTPRTGPGTTKKFRATTDGVAFEVEAEVERTHAARATLRVREVATDDATAAGGAAAAAARDSAASFIVSADGTAETFDRVRIVATAAAATEHEHEPTALAGRSDPTTTKGQTDAAHGSACDESAAAGDETIAPIAPIARAVVVPAAATTWVFIEGEVWTVDVEPAERAARRPRAAAGAEALMAPMPATVIRVLVEPGRDVRRGETLLLLEAMKMELPVRAPRDGRVTALHCEAGQLVQPGVPLVELA